MPSVEPLRPASYVPRRFASGTFPVSRDYNLRQMLYNYAHRTDTRPDQIVPSFPFSDVRVYADTTDIEALAFHDFWGCLLTPENVAGSICTDDLRYHVWVATKRVVESGRVELTDKKALIRAVMDQFMVELGLVLLDLCPGPLVLFVDPRLHDNADEMVSRATALVAKLDEAQVRRWRIIVTLPATEEGITAARTLTNKHGIQTNLALVSCRAHAAACIEAGAGMISMSVESIMEWFEQQCDVRADRLTQDHPGIEAIQSCATFIHRNGINTTLLTTDVRKWTELKQLGGIGATALRKDQLDQIPMQRLTTWYPRADDDASPTHSYPALVALDDSDPDAPHLMHRDRPDSGRGFLAVLPAEARSLASAVLYVRLARMTAQMEAIEAVVWCEVKRRIRLERTPLEWLYRRPETGEVEAGERQSRSGSSKRKSIPTSTSKKRSRSSTSTSSRTRRTELDANDDATQATRGRMVEDVDYF